ncbi:MAG: hypothetical protein LBR70_02445 [Lactobacillaceae bacterium]|jgi:hypothetical protein|nr:hypothetical protein [Lactobacillaceae bacterium]
MKNLSFFAVLTRVFVAVSFLALFASCSKDLFEEYDNTEPVDPTGGYEILNDDLKHNRTNLCEVNFGYAKDNMTSTVYITSDGATTPYTQYPKFEANANRNLEGIPTISSYTLNLHDLNITAGEPDVENDGTYYTRTEDWNGSFFVNNEEIDLDAKNIDFSRFFAEELPVLQMPYTILDSMTINGYTIENIGEQVNGFKEVTFKIILNAHRTRVGSSKIVDDDVQGAIKSRSAASTKSDAATSDLIDEVAYFYVAKIAGNVDPIDEYTGYGNVRQNVVYDFVNQVVRVTVLADEYYTISGTKTVTVKEDELPFGWSASGVHEFESASKNVSAGNTSSDENSEAEVNLYQIHTMVNTYGVKGTDFDCNKEFTFWWTTGAVMFHGDRIDYNIATPKQTPAGISQESETSNSTYKTITTYSVKNAITFGTGSKTNDSKVIVKVKKDETKPVTVENVELSQKKVEELARTKITVTANITYSDGTTAVKDTVVYRTHGADNAATINRTKADKTVKYVINNVSSVASGNRINYTNSVTVKYCDNIEDVMNFASFQEVGGTITFWGKSIELQVSTMVPSYVSLVEGSTIESGDYNVTTWNVNAKSVIGTQTLNQKGLVNVSVEKEQEYFHPTKGKLVKAYVSYSACNTTANKLWEIVVKQWENQNDGSMGYEIEVDGVLQSKFWTASELHPSMVGNITSATSKGLNNDWMPSDHKIHSASSEGYWSWTGKDASGKEYRSTFPYKLYKYDSSYCQRSVTCKFVGDQMQVIENGQVIRSYSRVQ